MSCGVEIQWNESLRSTRLVVIRVEHDTVTLVSSRETCLEGGDEGFCPFNPFPTYLEGLIAVIHLSRR